MGDRVFNFSPGPAVLPESVLREVQEALWNVADSGIGILEHSHRGKVVARIFEEAEQDCRALAGIPDHYRILFLQGGASLQFAMLPANYLRDDGTADYIDTGSWSKKAIREAGFYGHVHVAASSKDANFARITRDDEAEWSESPTYVHFTSNNTIFGTEFPAPPRIPDGPFLACDASSDIFSRPIEVERYGLVYAGAQKNLGPAGLTVVIVREDLLEPPVRELPTMLRYRTHAEQKSMYNTPPVFGVYVMGRVLKWLLAQGGLAEMARRNEEKAAVLYAALDRSEFYRPFAHRDSRSRMNVTFTTPSPELDALFVQESAARGLDGLKGHRSVGGMRASIYNAFPRAGCDALAQFMTDFEKKHG